MGFEKKSRPACRAYLSVNQSIPNATWTSIVFDTEEYDTDAMFTPPSDHITIKRLAGYYLMLAQVVFDSTSTAGQIRAMSCDGGWDYRPPVGAWGLTSLATHSIRHKAIDAEEYVIVYQNSGASMDVRGGQEMTWLSVTHDSGR